MKSYFDRLEDELQAAAEARIAATRPRGGQSRRRWLSAVPVLSAVAVALLIAGGALVLLRGARSQTRPQPAAVPGRPVGPHPPVAGDQYVAAAFNAAYRGRGCSLGEPAQPTVSQGAPSETLRSQLPILNRPSSAADRLPASQPLRAVAGGGSGIYVRYIRHLRTYRGMSFYLVPIAHLGFPPVPVSVAERCYRAAVDSLRAQLAHVAPGLRQRTLRYGLYQFAEYRFNLAHSRVQEGVSITELAGPFGGGGGTGGTPATMLARRGILGATVRAGSVVWYGLVPSAVHTVTLKFAGGRQGQQTLRPIAVSAAVLRNLFVLTVPHFGPLRSWPTTMIWRNESGQIIKAIDERPYHP